MIRVARLGIALLLVAPLLAAAARPARAQVSPGPLAAAHRDLDGTLQCLQCHPTGNGPNTMDGRCLACHREVARLRAARRGYHARVADRRCAECHPDHGGRDFQLIAWDGGSPERFDHHKAGFVLEGRHAALKCRDCHQPKFQHPAPGAPLRVKDPARSWLGLEPDCASCHADPHRGQLGARCASCHDQQKWKPAPGFDHAKSDYPLTGAHAKVECAKCHLAPAVATTRDAEGQPIAQWKPLPHADCADCHRDPHAGRFPGACAKCHRTESFHAIIARGFDHDRTRYPLRGAHVKVACAKCHDEKTAFGPKPRFARCGDCHRDAHAGTATVAGKPADCAACHDVKGFTPSTFPLARHQQSKYPLEGAHREAACRGCHVQRAPGRAAVAALGPARVVMRPAYGDCTDCHGDPHRGRFAAKGARPHDRGCRGCHDLRAFRPSTYDAAAHASSRFPLEGAHRAVPCQACHEELKAAPARATTGAAAKALQPLPFERAKRACADCHENPHGDQFAARRDHGACDGCHDLEAFRPARRFDHARDARFKLEGAHARTPCASCHPTERRRGGRGVVRWRPVPTRCVDCHAAGTPESRPGGRSSERIGNDVRTLARLVTTREVRHDTSN